MTQPNSVLEQVDVPRPQQAATSARSRGRPHLDARATGWLIEQRARIQELELDSAALRGELEASARVERGAQRYCDRLEEELESSRKREATLARALGYAEAQRDQLAKRLEAPKDTQRPRKRRLGWFR